MYSRSLFKFVFSLWTIFPTFIDCCLVFLLSVLRLLLSPNQRCRLVELDGISPWVYSDWPVEGQRQGILQRESSPGSGRKLVLAELNYIES